MQTSSVTSQTRLAFTIVEVLVAVSVLALLGTGAIAGLLTVNRMVVGNRLATNAQAIAQTQIDRILGEPYPEGCTPPVELTVGTTTQAGVPIYTDPVSGQVIVRGTITTTISDATRVIVASRPAPKLFKATVTVGYNFTGQPAAVALTTVRTVD